mmetsp:Transcript_1001/g.3028  ORF Transcript_1001/g.3028 Transcript_1001/m.3028 type:complete len:206 (+) Transcript_1001:2018-2635(+)
MVIFRDVIKLDQVHLSDDIAVELGLQLFDHASDKLQLLLRVHVATRPVLRSGVVALPVEGSRIVCVQEELIQQLPKRDRARVVHDPHHLVVTGAPTAHVLVRHLLHLPIAVAYLGVNHAGNALEPQRWSPEASRTKVHLFHLLRRNVLDDLDGVFHLRTRQWMVGVDRKPRGVLIRHHSLKPVAQVDRDADLHSIGTALFRDCRR